MSPTLGPSPPLATPPLRPFASYRTPSSPLPVQQLATARGLLHADNTLLDPRQYKQTSFAKDLLRLLATLNIPTWPALSPTSIKIYKVSGSLTNAVFFISHPSAKTLLLRIYGSSSSSLVSRPHELHTLHILSSRYGIGPRVYGTFANGRVEQYFESEALTLPEMRHPQVSAWIAMRMAELHCVDLGTVDLEEGEEREGVRKNVRSWLAPARDVLQIAKANRFPGAEALELERFEEEWERYWEWLMKWESKYGQSPRVFAHNDTQYGNLLRLKELRKGEPDHHKIIVVDFEYASPNPAAFDIANHFHEWTADYHSATPHELRPEKYPGLSARRNFYIAYLTQMMSKGETSVDSTGRTTSTGPRLLVPTEAEVNGLEEGVKAWSAASHGMWAVWGIVQAREDVEGGNERGEFDYVGYAASRMRMFRESVASRQTVE